MARTKDLQEKTVEEMEAEFNINFEVADLATIHESYQFLMKKYVENQAPDIKFLNLDDIKKKNERRKKKREELGVSDEEEIRSNYTNSRYYI